MGAAVDVDGSSVVLAGRTAGDWAAVNAGGSDFAAVKLSADDGSELWRFQVCRWFLLVKVLLHVCWLCVGYILVPTGLLWLENNSRFQTVDKTTQNGIPFPRPGVLSFCGPCSGFSVGSLRFVGHLPGTSRRVVMNFWYQQQQQQEAAANLHGTSLNKTH